MESSLMTDRTKAIAAAEELLKRRSTRKSLAEWARHKGFEPAKHHLLIINEMESFLEGEDEVLLLFAPPGSAKSTYVSVLLPSWYLANNPTHSILAATHNVEFAERWGRRIRNDIAADSNILGIALSEDSKAAARWSLESGGEYYGVGAGTAYPASVPISASVMTCSAHARMLTPRPSGRSVGIGIKTTLAPASSREPSAF
jgi:hypothetical protein